MKKITHLLLILVSAFALTSCGGDSKEAVVNDSIDLLKEGMEAMAAGDTDAIASFEEKTKKIDERAKALGIDMNDPSSLPDDLKKKIEDATKEAQEAAAKKLAETMKKATEALNK